MNAPITPRSCGCRWPAEWERHAATWVAWPINRKSWPGRFDSIPAVFARIIKTLAQFEPVHVLAGGVEAATQARSMVGHLDDVVLHDICTNDAWVRDYGPTFLLGPADDGGQAECALSVVDWQYNAWGGKYPPWDFDNDAARQIADRLHLRRFQPGVVLEGGSIDGNGRGIVMTTETCLLDPKRNAEATRDRMEQVLKEYCCASDVIWLPGGPMAGDDTDGHVDQLARFVGPHRIVVAVEEDKQDENYAPLQANLRRLQQAGTLLPEPLEIIPLPLPRAIYIRRQRVPASYCNFYIANGCVLLPLFDDPADDVARRILEPLFPDRDVVGVPAGDLIFGLGAFHCMTQQQPAADAERLSP